MKEGIETSTTLRVAVASPDDSLRETVCRLVSASSLATLVLEIDHYGFREERTRQKLMSRRPDILLLDLAEPEGATRALQELPRLLGEGWVFALSDSSSPELIIQTMRAGAREFLVKPLEASSLEEAFGRYLAQKKEDPVRDQGEIICVAGAKGGSGATSLAINLAVALAELPRAEAAVVDLKGPVGDLSVYLNLRPQFTLLDALHSASRLDPVLLDSYLTRSCGVSVLPGLPDFRPKRTADAAALTRVLEVFQETHSHVVVDVAPQPDDEQFRVSAQRASSVLLVLTPELPSLWRARRLLDFLDGRVPAERLKLVLNRAQRFQEILDEDMENALGLPLYWKLPNDYRTALAAVNSGRPVIQGPSCELAEKYRGLAFALTGATPEKKKRAFLGFSL